MKSLACFVVFASLLVSGCGCSSHGDETVLAVVNGHQLTAEYVKNVVLIQARMAELAGRAIDSKAFANWANSRAMQIIPQLVSAELLEEEIRRAGVQPTEADELKVLTGYNRATSQKAPNLEALAPLFGEQERAFREQFARSLRFAAYWRHQRSDAVSAKDVAGFYAAKSNDVRRAAWIDKTARERGEKAWARLQRGEPWEKVAADCSEDKLVDETNAEFARDWATVGLDGFGYPELAKAIFNLEVGQFSKPVETEEGLMIVKVTEKAGNNKTLARILFRMAQPVEVPAEDEAREQLASERAERAQLALQERLMKEATIEYPLGSNFVYRIWEEVRTKK